MDILIKKPSEIDIPKILPHWKEQCNLHYKREIIKTNNPFILCAYNDKKIIGFITFGESKVFYRDTRIRKYGEVYELFIDKKHRRQGVGYNLLKKVEEYFKKRKLTWVKIQSAFYNKNAAKFYLNKNYTLKQIILYKKV